MERSDSVPAGGFIAAFCGAGRPAGQFLPQQSPMLYLIDHGGYIRRSYSPSGNDLEKISSDLGDLLRAVPLRRDAAAADAGA